VIENTHERETKTKTENDSESLRSLVELSGFRRKLFGSDVMQIFPVHAESTISKFEYPVDPNLRINENRFPRNSVQIFSKFS
jgi:hypothetical protein